MKRFLTKRNIYILLFAILYLIVAFSSFWHAIEFFALTNYSWMSIILAFAFEIGQAAVLFAILTSSKERSKITPWILMCILTLVQIIGNVYSSYKYIMLNASENLRYFKEPIFIWMDLPDAQATVIITYISSAILPLCALLLTSMIANYLEDNSKESSYIEDNSKETTKDIEDNANDEIVEESNEIELDEPVEDKSMEDKSMEEVEGVAEKEQENETVKGKTHFVNV